MPSLTLTLNDAEQNALRQLLDISLRQAGLYALDVVSHFNSRLNEAVQAGHFSAEPRAASKAAPAAASQPVTQAGASSARSDPASQGKS